MFVQYRPHFWLCHPCSVFTVRGLRAYRIPGCFSIYVMCVNALTSFSTPARSDLARPRQLVSAHALPAVLASTQALLFDVGFGQLLHCELQHIPGAAYLELSQFEAPPLYNRVSDAALLAALLALGIRHDSTVILYGRSQL